MSRGLALFLGVNHQLFNSFLASSIFIPFPRDFPITFGTCAGAGHVQLSLRALPQAPRSLSLQAG